MNRDDLPEIVEESAGSLAANWPFLAGGGAMGALMRAHDWSTSPLGSPDDWPQSLRTTVSLMLNSRYPMFVAWGPDLAFLYNDGYRPIFGAKHPHTLGLPFAEVWSEIWDDIRPLVDRALAGEATFHENLHLVMERNGFPEDTWYTFSYSPVRDESGDVGGMFCACTETTKIVQAEKENRLERERLAQMFGQAPGFMALLEGPDHRFELTNPAYQRLIGHREVVGTPVAEALPETVEQGFIALLDKVYRSGEAFASHGARVGLQNEPGGPVDERYLDFVYQPLTDADGRVTGIFVEGQDVTERSRAEAELRESEERFRRIADSAPVPIWVTLLDRKRGFVNRAYVDFLGTSYDEAIEFDWRTIIHPDDHDRIVAESIAGEASLKPFVLEGRYRGGDEWRWLRSTSQPRWGPSSEHAGFIGVAHDITHAKEAEAALRASEARLREQFENANDFIFTADLQMRLTSCNPAVAAALGHAPEALVGRSISEFVPPEVWEKNKAMLAAKLDGSQDATRYEVEVLAPDGGRMRWEINSRLTRDAGGAPTGLHAIGRDVTEAKEAEAELRASEERLKLVQAAGRIGSFDYDLQADDAICSPEYYEIHGLPAGAPINRESWTGIIHPDHRGDAIDMLNRAITERRAFSHEYRIVRADTGEIRWLSGRAEAVFDDAGQPWRFVGGVIDITERREAEEAARASEEQLRTITDSLPVLIAFVDADERYRFANKAYEDWFGAPAADVIGKPVSEVLSDKGYATVEPLIRRSLAGERLSSEASIPNPAGGIRHVHVDHIPARDDDGAVVGYYVLVQDISERKAAEAALRESEVRYHDLFNSIDAGFCIIEMKFDADGGPVDYWFVEVNPAFERQTGIEDAAGKWMRELAPDHEQHWFDTYGAVAATGEPVRFELRAAALDDRWFDVYAYPVGGPGNRRVAILFNDITPRRRAEDALREASDRARQDAAEREAILEQLAEGVIVTDAQGRITFVNAAAVAIHGVAKLDVGPDDYSETYHLLMEDGRPYPPHDLPLARAVLKGQTIHDARWRIRRPDGSEVLAIGSAQPVRGPDGAITGAVLTLRDDTRRRAAEDALRELNETLETRVVAEASERLRAEESLRQAQKMEAIGQLTGGIAHDFNNLLTIILNSVELLGRPEISDERRARYISAIGETAERAARLTAQLLAFARRQPLSSEAFDVCERVESMESMLRTVLGARVAIAIETGPVCCVEADPNQFDTAVLNMAVNARDAMPNGGKLTIETAEADEGTLVELRIADTGAGIAPELVESIFEPFFTTKGVGKGTGLGLSQVYGFARQSGGDVRVESTPGEGATFILSLPHAPHRRRADGPMGPGTLPAGPDAIPGKGRILVVEDNQDVGEFGGRLLEGLGYSVVHADGAEAALALIADDAAGFDAVLSDVVMPGEMDGLALARALRRDRPELPVILTTGYAHALVDDAAHGFEVLRKPYSIAQLSLVLHEALGKGG